MENQPKDALPQWKADQRSAIDYRRRAYFPKEAVTSKGTTVFRTIDGDVYCRLENNVIRRTIPKVNGKLARKERAAARRAANKP